MPDVNEIIIIILYFLFNKIDLCDDCDLKSLNNHSCNGFSKMAFKYDKNYSKLLKKKQKKCFKKFKYCCRLLHGKIDVTHPEKICKLIFLQRK